MTTTAMLHEVDPRTDLLNKIGDISHIKVLFNQVVVATYIRPEMTKGGLILPGSVQNEDKYQGKVGLVIARGPQAFVDDDRQKFDGQNVELGDWVAYRMTDGWQFTLKGRPTPANPKGEYHCRVMIDVDIKAVLSHPDDLI